MAAKDMRLPFLGQKNALGGSQLRFLSILSRRANHMPEKQHPWCKTTAQQNDHERSTLRRH